MTDVKGDPAKQPTDCKSVFTPEPETDGRIGTWSHCPHLENTYEGFDGERWRCSVCGESFFLDYEDMK